MTEPTPRTAVLIEALRLAIEYTEVDIRSNHVPNPVLATAEHWAAETKLYNRLSRLRFALARLTARKNKAVSGKGPPRRATASANVKQKRRGKSNA